MTRPLAWFALSFSAGVFLAQYLSALQPWLAAAFLLLGAVGLLQKDRVRKYRITLVGFGAAFALLWNMGYTALVQTPARAYAGTDLQDGKAIVWNYAEPLSSAEWDEWTLCRIRVQLVTKTGKHNAYLYAGDELLSLEPGNVIRADMTVTDATVIHGDEITSFTAKDVYLLLFPGEELAVESGDAGALRYLPQRMAHRVEECVHTLYEGDAAALILAILTGNKSGFGKEMYTVLAEAGILHIAAVSGLHCAFLLSMVQMLFGKRRRLVAAMAVPLLLFYALMVGAVPSVLRACIMMLLLLAAPLLKRENDSLTSFSAALMLILLLNPFAVASVSLQLSFAAVGGMMWLTPKLFGAMTGKRNRIWRFFASGVSATLGALVFTTPLSAWHFNSLVLISPISNILCLLVVNVLFALSLLTLPFALLLPSAAAVLALPAQWMAEYILFVARKLTMVPWHAVYFESVYVLCWLGFAYLLLAMVALRKTKTREKLFACMAAVLTLVLAVTFMQRDYRYGRMNIVALDVGQGQSILVSSADETALIDCGSGNSYISAGDVAGDMLLSMGAKQIDYLVLTHFHTDHVSGLPALLARVKAERMIMPRPDKTDEMGQMVLKLAERHDVDVSFIEKDTTFAFGEAELRVNAPVRQLTKLGDAENENGLTVLCSAGEFDFLVTGDMDKATEKRLVAQKKLPDVELMMVGHHGSDGSSSEELLTAVKPETAIISVGGNSYGHPAEGALQRLAKQGVELYRTDLQGHVRVSVR